MGIVSPSQAAVSLIRPNVHHGCVSATHAVFVGFVAAQEIVVAISLLDGMSDIVSQQDDSRAEVAIILVVIVGSHFFGLWGIILGPPLAAMGKDTIVYFAREWNRPAVLTDTETAPEEDVEMAESATGKPTELTPPNTQSHSS